MCNTFESKYKILEKIGEGSFSEVLKCEHKNTRTCYAAKLLKKNYKSEDGIQSCPEFIAAQKVSDHINLLNMLEYHYDSFFGKVIFIFELMDMSLYDYLKTKKKGLSECRARNYLHQTLCGLEHLHSHGLFHRDIKPENILIKFPSILYSPLSQSIQNEVVKLADLGSIRGIFSEPPYTEYISTRWYRSPECLLTIGNYGSKMDVWAAGCVFFEMLTLKPLFPGSNEVDQLHKIHQVVGSPQIQYLQRLKSQSQNCVSFPKLKGCGTDILLPFLTRNGRNVLRLMLEYDAEKRINVKRLLRHSYFDEIRSVPEISNMIKPKPIPQSCKRSIGDDGSYPILYPNLRKKAIKREHYSDELRRSKDNSLSSIKSSAKHFSMDSINESKYRHSGQSTCKCSTKSSTNYSHSVSSHQKIKYSIASLPLVDYKVNKIDDRKTSLPNSLKAKVDPNVIKAMVRRTFKSKSSSETGDDQKSKIFFTSRSVVVPKKMEPCRKCLCGSKNGCKIKKRLK